MPLDPHPPTTTVQPIQLEHLLESPFQPRQHVDPAALAELATSIRETGVLQPILVRVVGPEECEIVFGHRRAAAARLAGLTDIPAMVCEMTDDDVRTAQAIENLQREDLTPLDEAQQYKTLLAALKLDQKALAARVGKSEAHISQRLRLLTAVDQVQKAVAAGEISAEVGQLIARQPQSTQLDWLHQAKTDGGSEWNQDEGDNVDFPMTVDQLRLRIKLRTKPLGKAVFDITDAKLLPKAGACTACPHRSGNSPEHQPGEDPNRCGDAKCFDAKEDAHYTAKKKALQKANVKLLDYSKSYDAEHKVRRGQMIDLQSIDPAIDKDRPLAEVLGNKLAGAVALTDYSGGIKTIAMEPGALQKALKDAGITAESELAKQAAKKAKASETTKAQKSPKVTMDSYRLNREFEEQVREALCAAIATGGPQPGDLADAVMVMYAGSNIAGAALNKVFGGAIKGETLDFTKVNTLAAPVLARALMQLLVWQEVFNNGIDNESIERLIKRYAIDVEPIREKVYGKPEEKAKPAKAAKAKGKK
jgi:ParB/RepB/Spo0J family partition protein